MSGDTTEEKPAPVARVDYALPWRQDIDGGIPASTVLGNARLHLSMLHEFGLGEAEFRAARADMRCFLVEHGALA